MGYNIVCKKWYIAWTSGIYTYEDKTDSSSVSDIYCLNNKCTHGISFHNCFKNKPNKRAIQIQWKYLKINILYAEIIEILAVSE